MAERIEIKSITTPAGTALASPLVTDLNWRQGYPERVEIRVPPGPSGLVGIQITHSGEVVIPKDRTEWLITDDELVSWPMTSFPYNAKWAVRTYNLDVFVHTVQVRMLFIEVGTRIITPLAAPDFTPPMLAAPEGPLL